MKPVIFAMCRAISPSGCILRKSSSLGGRSSRGMVSDGGSRAGLGAGCTSGFLIGSSGNCAEGGGFCSAGVGSCPGRGGFTAGGDGGFCGADCEFSRSVVDGDEPAGDELFCLSLRGVDGR